MSVDSFLRNDATFVPVTTSTGATITPPANSTAQGLNVAQSGPISGTTSTTINYDQIVINGDNHNNAGNLSNGLNLDFGFGGANFQGAINGLFVNTHLNNTGSASNPNPFYTAITAQAEAFNSDQATSSLIGVNAFVQTQTGATGYNNITGIQSQAGMISSGGAVTRVGMNPTAVGGFRAASAIADAGIVVGSTSSANAWANGLVFTHFNGAAPLATTGTVLASDTNTDTVANFADFHTWTFTGNIFNFANFKVDGGGNTSPHLISVAAPTNANAATAGVAVGQLYRDTADPSKVYVRTV